MCFSKRALRADTARNEWLKKPWTDYDFWTWILTVKRADLGIPVRTANALQNKKHASHFVSGEYNLALSWSSPSCPQILLILLLLTQLGLKNPCLLVGACKTAHASTLNLVYDLTVFPFTWYNHSKRNKSRVHIHNLYCIWQGPLEFQFFKSLLFHCPYYGIAWKC